MQLLLALDKGSEENANDFVKQLDVNIILRDPKQNSMLCIIYERVTKWKMKWVLFVCSNTLNNKQVFRII